MDAILRQRRTGDGEWSGEGKEAFGLRVAPWPDCNQHNIHPPRRRAAVRAAFLFILLP